MEKFLVKATGVQYGDDKRGYSSCSYNFGESEGIIVEERAVIDQFHLSITDEIERAEVLLNDSPVVVHGHAKAGSLITMHNRVDIHPGDRFEIRVHPRQGIDFINTTIEVPISPREDYDFIEELRKL